MENKLKDKENKRIAILLCKIFIPIIIIMAFINRWVFVEQFKTFYSLILLLYNQYGFEFLFWVVIIIIFVIIIVKIMNKYNPAIIKFFDSNFNKILKSLEVIIIMLTFFGTLLFLMMLGSIEYHYPTNGTNIFISNINVSMGNIGVSTIGKLYLSGYNHHWSMDVWIIIFFILILMTYCMIKNIFKNKKNGWYDELIKLKDLFIQRREH